MSRVVQCPAKFSSNLLQHICLEVSSTLGDLYSISWFRCVYLGLKLYSAVLQEQDWTALIFRRSCVSITHQIAKIEIYELKLYPMETCKFHKNSNISQKKKYTCMMWFIRQFKQGIFPSQCLCLYQPRFRSVPEVALHVALLKLQTYVSFD